MFFKTKGKEEAKQKFQLYRRVFGSPEGKEVFLDMCNKYHAINAHKPDDAFAEGQRSVICDIIYLTKMDLREFDKLLEGEMT